MTFPSQISHSTTKILPFGSARTLQMPLSPSSLKFLKALLFFICQAKKIILHVISSSLGLHFLSGNGGFSLLQVCLMMCKSFLFLLDPLGVPPNVTRLRNHNGYTCTHLSLSFVTTISVSLEIILLN